MDGGVVGGALWPLREERMDVLLAPAAPFFCHSDKVSGGGRGTKSQPAGQVGLRHEPREAWEQRNNEREIKS